MDTLCKQLEMAIRDWPQLESASFVHGMLTGELGGGENLSVSDFITGLLRELEATRVRESFVETLYSLYGETLKGLTSEDFALKLCLPDDEAPLYERARAVRDWCEGFVYGFGLVRADGKPPRDEVQEYLEVVMDVASMDLEALRDQEDAGLAAQLEEIIEFLRIGAITVYEHYHPTPPRRAEDIMPEPTHRTVQ